MQETRLLGIVMPSFRLLRSILDRVREKYNMPEVLPESLQLVETLRAERSEVEWAAVLADLEQELQAEVFSFPPEVARLIDRVVAMASQRGTPDRLAGANMEAGDASSSQLLAALLTIVRPVIEWRDRARTWFAQRLLDHPITGRPIELPEQLMYPMAFGRSRIGSRESAPISL